MAGRDRIIRRTLRERFVVTLHGGESFEGILMDADAKTIHLVDGFLIDPKRSRVPVDGDLYLPRIEVAYLQRPGGAA